jgi:hypothetical protein
LFCLYTARNPLFIGPNTLIFAASSVVAAVSILSDYLLTREMVYTRYNLVKSGRSRRIDHILGLKRGTDRLFMLAATFFLLSMLAFCSLIWHAFRQMLSQPGAAISGLAACTFMLVSISFYLTAAKITSYRSLHLP